jgi:hypothetical protein
VIAVVWWNAAHDPAPAPNTPKLVGSGDKGWPNTEEDRVCDRFMKLHNAFDPAALELIGRVPQVPAQPIPVAEADLLSTEFFLREGQFTIERCRRTGAENGVHAYVFRTKGNAVGPQIRTLLPDGTEMGPPPPQRIMINPDIHVEVRGGKIFAVRATVQRD